MSIQILFDTLQQHGIECYMSHNGDSVGIPLTGQFAVIITRYGHHYQGKVGFIVDDDDEVTPFVRYQHVVALFRSCGVHTTHGPWYLQFRTGQQVVNVVSEIKRMMLL